MVADGLLTRQRYREVPPRVDYELTARSRELMPVLAAVALWGLDWVWSEPRPAEDVNIGAIMRLAPGMLASLDPLAETLELVVEAGDHGTRSFVVTAQEDGITLSEEPQVETDGRVRGSRAAWISALGPDADTGGLRFEGSRALADLLLQAFAARKRTHADVA